jgi:type I restriction enzyme S subunit
MEEWKEYKVEDVVNILDYKRVPLSSKERDTRKGIYPYYGAQGIIDYIDDYIFEGTYLLIAEDGENLKSQKQDIAQLASGKYWVNNHAHIVESNGRSDIRYLCYLLNSMDISGYITGSAQPKLNQANLSSIRLILPPLELQKQVADTLFTFDKKIANNRRINDNLPWALWMTHLILLLFKRKNDNLEQQAQALFKSWFVDFDPFKDGEFVESEMGLIPKGWRVGLLSEIGEIVGGSTPSKAKSQYYTSNGIPWLTPKDLSNSPCKFTAKGEIDITKEGYASCSTKIMPKGTVLFSSRAPIGYVSIAKNEICTNQGFKSVVPKEAGTAFIYYFLKTSTKDIENKATGSTFKEASGALMKSLPTIIPTKSVLYGFEQIMEPIFRKQETIEDESRRLAQLRDTLLPRLMSGELKVNEI